LFVAKLPLTFAKLNSIPLNRARGPLNELVARPVRRKDGKKMLAWKFSI